MEIFGYPNGNTYVVTQKQLLMLMENKLIVFEDYGIEDNPDGHWEFDNSVEQLIRTLIRKKRYEKEKRYRKLD